MPATRKGVFHNLKESEYTISNGEIVFFFSSKHLQNKFMEGYEQHRKNFAQKMAKIATNPLNMEILADIDFYKNTEKRGFYAWLKGISITHDEVYRYSLRKMTEKSCEWVPVNRHKTERDFNAQRRVISWQTSDRKRSKLQNL